MATGITPTHEAQPAPAAPGDYWFSRFSKPLIFLIIALAIMGAYVAFNIPVAVFPEVDFPRIIIGIDNGVMPIDQMMVTITRPLEDAVNSVPGLQVVNSITSRGSAEVDLFFNWNVDMLQTLQLVNSAVAQVQTTLPNTAKIDTHRLTFASFPILGYSLTSDSVPQTQLWELATYTLKPQLNRLNGVATVVVARWEGALDMKRMQSVLAGETDAEAEEPEAVADARAEFALQVPEPGDQGQPGNRCDA